LNAYVRSVMEAAVAHNQTAAKDFLAHNTHEKGVTTTASGCSTKSFAGRQEGRGYRSHR
jgi:FKBP-type peptidyl-prolyl cis-trans isomerase